MSICPNNTRNLTDVGCTAPNFSVASIWEIFLGLLWLHSMTNFGKVVLLLQQIQENSRYISRYSPLICEVQLGGNIRLKGHRRMEHAEVNELVIHLEKSMDFMAMESGIELMGKALV